jgi:catechol 2,3-dioxygenase-like lactoylglutathione lyase family enzyme
MNSGETVAPGSPFALPAARDKRVSALDHVALACDDLEDALARLLRHDVSFTRSEVPAVREIQLFFRDPSGIGVELIFPSAKAD